MIKQPTKPHQSKISLAGNYSALVKQVRDELNQLEVFLKRKTIESYWNIGKFIHQHLLENKKRAEYGNLLYERLSEDVGRDISTLRRTVQFHLAYSSIPATWRELNWSQYRQLITIKDKQKRKEFEAQLVKKGLDARKSQAFLNFKRFQSAAKDDPEKPIAQLSFNRGKLLTYSLIENEESSELFLDLGFKIRKRLKDLNNLKLAKGDCVQVSSKNSLLKVDAEREELFTYTAKIKRIIDGDTLIALIDLGFGLFVQQKLRLRGIDCPEMNTGEGVKAKKFVQAQLGNLDFIIVKTHKDSSDKYDRYLADIFYLANEKDPRKVAQEGKYLNQELLNARLAWVY